MEGIQAKDLGEVTTNEEICEALRDQLKLENVQKMDVKSLRQAYGGTQTTTLTMAVASCRKYCLRIKFTKDVSCVGYARKFP